MDVINARLNTIRPFCAATWPNKGSQIDAAKSNTFKDQKNSKKN